MNESIILYFFTAIGGLGILFLSGIYQELKGLNCKLETLNKEMSEHSIRITKIESRIETLPCKEKITCK